MWLPSPGRPWSREGELSADVLTVADHPAAKAQAHTACTLLLGSAGSIAIAGHQQVLLPK